MVVEIERPLAQLCNLGDIIDCGNCQPLLKEDLLGRVKDLFATGFFFSLSFRSGIPIFITTKLLTDSQKLYNNINNNLVFVNSMEQLIYVNLLNDYWSVYGEGEGEVSVGRKKNWLEWICCSHIEELQSTKKKM